LKENSVSDKTVNVHGLFSQWHPWAKLQVQSKPTSRLHHKSILMEDELVASL